MTYSRLPLADMNYFTLCRLCITSLWLHVVKECLITRVTGPLTTNYDIRSQPQCLCQSTCLPSAGEDELDLEVTVTRPACMTHIICPLPSGYPCCPYPNHISQPNKHCPQWEEKSFLRFLQYSLEVKDQSGVYSANKYEKRGVETRKKIRTVKIYKVKGAIEKVFP